MNDNMNDNSFALMPGITLLIICVGICAFVMCLQHKEISELKRNSVISETSYKNQAIQLGYAEFDRTNGNWQWITNR